MAKAFFILLTYSLVTVCNAQTIKVSDVRVSFLGIGGGYELPIANYATFSTDLMLEGGLRGGFSSGTDYLMGLSLILEPRYYYNLAKRSLKQKKVDANSANFISIELSYAPTWIKITNDQNYNLVETMYVVPKFGLRRKILTNLIFHFAIGYGSKFPELKSREQAALLDIQIRYRLDRN